MSAEDPQTDREWLIRIDGKIDALCLCQKDHEDRIRTIEVRQNQWIGKDTAISVISSLAVSLTGLWIALNTIFSGK